MLSLAEDAKKIGRTNVAFLALFVCGKVCVSLSPYMYKGIGEKSWGVFKKREEFVFFLKSVLSRNLALVSAVEKRPGDAVKLQTRRSEAFLSSFWQESWGMKVTPNFASCYH